MDKTEEELLIAAGLFEPKSDAIKQFPVSERSDGSGRYEVGITNYAFGQHRIQLCRHTGSPGTFTEIVQEM